MIVIGLTGGIGTGKSTVAEYLISKGFRHIDADKIGWEVTVKGSPLLTLLDQHFGPEGEYGDGSTEVLNEDGSLNRKAMASVAFSDKNKTAAFNELMFRIILEEVERRIESFREEGDDPVLLDAPLLFEAGADKYCNLILLITADMDLRIARVCNRDGSSREEVQQRIDAQMSDEEKAARSDFIIDNSGNLEELYEKINEIFPKICVDNI